MKTMLSYEIERGPEAFVEPTDVGADLVLPLPTFRSVVFDFSLAAIFALMFSVWTGALAFGFISGDERFVQRARGVFVTGSFLALSSFAAVHSGLDLRTRLSGRLPRRVRIAFVSSAHRSKNQQAPARISARRSWLVSWSPQWVIRVEFGASIWKGCRMYAIGKDQQFAESLAAELRTLLRLPPD
ncbi:hypothetical protein [Humisphaera borealis]|uniref:Uncharacterized protein n=1 Tax=Humisphaera borealis TaxID=2807512 RepID=A0A7M2X3B0_9BACT|nr:hypothetical protein [Humisphaera borealis]QOV92164.1 hypothetical protein IPV69_12730 [Humisphaera borealis]